MKYINESKNNFSFDLIIFIFRNLFFFYFNFKIFKLKNFFKNL
jgi:hypothetical protein